MKKFKIMTTSMREIIVTARDIGEARKIASGQFQNKDETVMIISSKCG